MSKVPIPEPEGFAEFWAEWQPIARHTDGRGLARETFRRHVLNGVDPQDIIDGAKWFIRSITERDRPYVPLSATWLNRESYLDLCDKERAFQERRELQVARPSNVTPIIQPRKGAVLLEWEEMQKAKQG